jgi:gas vesicle protein
MTNHHYSYFFWGIGMGAVVGLLCAPRSGVRTRVLLLRRAKRTQDLISRQATELCDEAARKILRRKQTLQRTAEGVAEAFKAGKHVLTR